MPDRFTETVSFLNIAESGNLSVAARKLGMSLAAMSRRLAQLEERLGVPLIRRNSRHMTLTDEGRLYYEKAGRAVAELEEAEREVMRASADPAGVLRVTTTVNFGRRRLAPLLQQFSMLHPDVTVHLETSDQPNNIIESGSDLAICFDAPPDSRLTLKRLADNPRVMCAAPAYLERRGRPASTAELADHDCISIGDFNGDAWRFIDFVGARPRQALSTNDGELAREWALHGAGIVIKSMWDVREDLQTGRLEAVLPDLSLPSSPIVALYTQAQGDTPKVRRCLRFLADNLDRAA